MSGKQEQGQEEGRKDSPDQKALQDLFARVQKAPVELSPYLKTRVLAHWREKRAPKGLLFWQWLSGVSLAGVLALSFVSYQLLRQKKSDGLTQQAYVIHIDFNQSDRDLVAQAEVALPEHVHFVSSNKEIREERKLTLPVSVKALGRGKLPFVVSSDISGEKSIRVRLLNEKNEVVREQVLKLTFAKQGNPVVF